VAPPPQKGGAPPAKGKGKAAAAAGAGAASAGKAAPRTLLTHDTPFGRRVHWVQPAYENIDGTVFGEVFESGVDFDPELLKAILATDKENKPTGDRVRRTIVRKDTGIKVLDASRAQNMAIVLSKLSMTTEELCECLRTLNFSHARLSTEDLESVEKVLPTTEESKKLLEHREKFEELRDIEQKVMPFCALKRISARLKLMNFIMTHSLTYQTLLDRCLSIRAAMEETRSSEYFREVLGQFLHVGNFINHGVDDMREGTVRGFAIESLNALAAFKMGNGSTLHYICLTMMRADDRNFLKNFQESLRHVPGAAREKTQALRASIDVFAKEVQFANRELEQLDAESDGYQGLKELLPLLTSEVDQLTASMTETTEVATEVQKYFSVSDKSAAKLPPCEDFLKHIADFMVSLEKTWTEVQKNPRRWRQIERRGSNMSAAPSGEMEVVDRRKSMPAPFSPRPQQQPSSGQAASLGRPKGRSATICPNSKLAPHPEQLEALAASAAAASAAEQAASSEETPTS